MSQHSKHTTHTISLSSTSDDDLRKMSQMKSLEATLVKAQNMQRGDETTIDDTHVVVHEVNVGTKWVHVVFVRENPLTGDSVVVFSGARSKFAIDETTLVNRPTPTPLAEEARQVEHMLRRARQQSVKAQQSLDETTERLPDIEFNVQQMIRDQHSAMLWNDVVDNARKSERAALDHLAAAVTRAVNVCLTDLQNMSSSTSAARNMSEAAKREATAKFADSAASVLGMHMRLVDDEYDDTTDCHVGYSF